MKYQTLEVKATDRPGRFTAYAAVFNVLDRQNDRIQRGAFSKSLAQLAADGSFPALLAGHDQSQFPVGKILSAREDERGLLIEGELSLGTERGREAYELLKDGALKGLSIGYRVAPGGSKSEGNGTRILTEVELLEVSLVAVPANPEARVLRVKSMKASEVRQVLTEHLGLSRSQADTYAIAGLRAITKSDADAERLAARLLSYTK